ncbi:sterol desaturase family protein [Parendozoicomonas haliclonae]|uniref:Fatty acid hydroxylase superfamily protein n=1 Tax=Parendozoicomonas haliclonae TaxID=1960125 RepID=A0A1X7ANW8_9GAMM|nr:sterol desaturase family protein [Parendozoicomonas haliclonae]SMA49955.1 Fatty acid hydroxylase superfamily protein [Parendozoicomonas haliclonae]
MEFLNTINEYMGATWLPKQVWDLELFVDDWFFVLAMLVFVVEMTRYVIKGRFTKDLAGDTVANFITLAGFISLTALIATGYTAAFFVAYEFRIADLPITGWTILGCLILADLAYYWEHRFLHVNGFGWATHTVHHSSPHFNISVAYRHGPMDWFFPFFFHVPLVLMGFHPVIVFCCEVIVQVYQTLLHTESVRRLPRPIEAIMNTPSHHRVHHATNRQYLDKNYAGIFIIWDRMFGTFAKEEEPVKYGVFPRINSVNPVKIFFSGYLKLGQRLWSAPSWSYRIKLLCLSPTWAWEQEQKQKQAKEQADATIKTTINQQPYRKPA